MGKNYFMSGITDLNTNLADETFVIQEQILKRLKKDDGIRIATEVYADYYESLAEKSTQEGENLRAVIMLKKHAIFIAR